MNTDGHGLSRKLKGEGPLPFVDRVDRGLRGKVISGVGGRQKAKTKGENKNNTREANSLASLKGWKAGTGNLTTRMDTDFEQEKTEGTLRQKYWRQKNREQ